MKKILIIEDNEMMRLFLSNYLSKDYVTISVNGPLDGLEKICDINQLNLVITDYKSNESKERQELLQLQSKLKWLNIPHIMLTDNDKSEQRIDALNMGVQDCISKPFNPIELAMRIKNHINNNPSKIAYRPVA